MKIRESPLVEVVNASKTEVYLTDEERIIAKTLLTSMRQMVMDKTRFWYYVTDFAADLQDIGYPAKRFVEKDMDAILKQRENQKGMNPPTLFFNLEDGLQRLGLRPKENIDETTKKNMIETIDANLELASYRSATECLAKLKRLGEDVNPTLKKYGQSIQKDFQTFSEGRTDEDINNLQYAVDMKTLEYDVSEYNNNQGEKHFWMAKKIRKKDFQGYVTRMAKLNHWGIIGEKDIKKNDLPPLKDYR